MRTMALNSVLLFGCLGCATSHNSPSAERGHDSSPANKPDEHPGTSDNDTAKAGAKNDARDELVAATRAEDEAVKALDTAVKARERPEVIQPLVGEYKQRIDETDALVNQVFTPEVIDATPWTDLLSGIQKDRWQHVAFTRWRIEDGVLDCVGPDLDAKMQAIMSIGDLEQWRDYVLDIDFALVEGESTFHYRLGSAVNNSTLSFNVSTAGGAPFKAGAPNQMTVTVLGCAWKVDFADPDHPPHDEFEVPWTIRRKGGIAVSVPPGSAIRITRMRIKVLR